MALLIWVGHWSSTQDTYSRHSRFFFKLGPTGYVYPTLNNVLNFVRSKAPKNKTLVLVAGSSIMLGAGQKNDHLWTDKLQEKLGSDYRVVNISFRGCSFISVGLPVAMILSHEYPDFYFVFDSGLDAGLLMNTTWLPLLESRAYPYHYMLWQARFGQQWLQTPSIDVKLKEALFNRDSSISISSQENLLRALFETATRSSDLWNFIGYYYLFPIYSDLLNPDISFWTPRVKLPDDEYDQPPSPERHKQFLDRHSGDSVASIIALNTAIGLDLSPSAIESVSKKLPDHMLALNEMIPESQMRKRFLLCITPVSSYYFDLLKPDEKSRYFSLLSKSIENLRKNEYNSILLGEDYPPEDYVDLKHFSDSAAPKMADEVASALLEMVQKDRAINSK